MTRQDLFRHLRNAPGYRITRKIVIIESDDWGGIRMPSLSSFERLKKAGLNLSSFDAERYNLNDSLATSADLEKLFEILEGVHDRHGTSPIFTALCVVANPDFEQIRKSDFREYFYQPFTETLKLYPGCEDSFKLWKKGIEHKLFLPQMHGREHLNVTFWMRALRSGDKQTIMAFNEGMWGFVPDQKLFPDVVFQAAFLLGSPEELQYHAKVLKEGLDLFETLFGYRAEYFVAPNGPFNNSLNKVLVENGIKYRYGSRQIEPLGNGRSRQVFHWPGQKDKYGIRYIARNCFFEPSHPGQDWVDSCLNEMKIAFLWNKPAIISSHRVNYVGSLNKSNREYGLSRLSELLSSILKAWPDVTFMTTPEFGKLIEKRSE